MSAVIKWVAVIINCINAVNVIDIAISVIVNSIAWYFTCIYPHIGCQVSMAVINSCINDSDNNIGYFLL